MAWVDIHAAIPHPVHHDYNASHQPRAINGTNTAVAYIIQAPKTGTLDKAEFRIGSVTTAQDVKVSFQDWTTDGDPDGTVDQYRVISSGSIAADSWTEPGLMTSDGTDGGTKRSVTIGDHICVVIEWDSTAGDLEIDTLRMLDNMGTNGSILFPYTLYYNGSSWVHDGTSTDGKHPCLALKYDDGTYGWLANCLPVSDLTHINGTTNTFDINTSPDERGARFKFPIKVRAYGFWVNVEGSVADFDFKLYEDDDTLLCTITNYGARTVGETQDRIQYMMFDNNYTFEADTYYRLTMVPLSTTDVEHMRWHVPSAAHQEGFGTSVKDWQYTSRTDGGSWTNTDTERWWGGILINAIDVAASIPNKSNVPAHRRSFVTQIRSYYW